MLKVKYASDCPPCGLCGEPYCEEHDEHYSECDCPGPHQDDEYFYITLNGEEYAILLEST